MRQLLTEWLTRIDLQWVIQCSNESKTATVIILSAIGFLLCPNSIPAGSECDRRRDQDVGVRAPRLN